MTILTSISGDRKADLPPAPEVFNGYAFLLDNEKNDAVAPKKLEQPVIVSVKPRLLVARRQQRCVWLSLLALLVFVLLILGFICLYKNILIKRHSFKCGVHYRELAESTYTDRMIADGGEFEETVQIDGSYEKIGVPAIGDTTRSTVLHDFNVNYTAIIDKDNGNCFLMPLNRTLVLPPLDFWDLLLKLKTGYYVPDTYIVREEYRVMTPPLTLTELDNYGVYISIECHSFNTYKLIKNGEPFAMSKRAACSFAGHGYCLGDAGVDKMLCFKITGCI